MATSKQLLEEQGEVHGTDTDLTLCGICCTSIESPRALPCLHTFCFGCIEEWAKGKTEYIKCPLCKEDFPLPPEGVSGFRSNFFVTRLKEKDALKAKLIKTEIPCTSCDARETVAIAWCTDCKENLCSSCVKSHKTLKILKGHGVYSFDDIKSGKVDIQKARVTEYCTKHKGQVLWFFCETCGILICRDCTVVDHPPTKHMLVNVEEISGDQGKRVQELTSKCQEVAVRVEEAIEDADDVEKSLTAALQKAKAEADYSAAQIKEELLENLMQQQQKITAEIARIRDETKIQIKKGKDVLVSQRLQLGRALQMAIHVTESGSPYDLAAMYTTLTGTLQKLSELKPTTISRELSEVKFEANTDYDIDAPKLGVLTANIKEGLKQGTCIPNAKKPVLDIKEDRKQGTYIPNANKPVSDIKGKWHMERRFGQNEIQDGMGIAVYPTGNIAIACAGGKGSVRIFNQNGTFEHDVNVGRGSATSKPMKVAISSDGTLYITDTTPYVKVFDANARLINKFETIPPMPTKRSCSLAGLAKNDKKQLAIGDIHNQYISIHRTSGAHIYSFEVSVAPWFISTPQDDILIVSAIGSNPQIVDFSGQILHTITLPTRIARRSTGAHFIGRNELLIANQAFGLSKSNGIFHFSTDGKYLGYITNEVYEPTDLVLTEDGKLFVLERTHVTVFKKSKT